MDNIISLFFQNNFTEISKKSILDIDLKSFGKDSCWSWDNFASPLPNKENLSLVVHTKFCIIGFLIGGSYIMNDNEIAHINRIAVHPEYRHQNIGKLLIEQFENKAIKLGLTTSTLEFDFSLIVKDFYLKLGYGQLTDKLEVTDYLIAKSKNNIECYLEYNRGIFFKKLK